MKEHSYSLPLYNCFTGHTNVLSRPWGNGYTGADSRNLYLSTMEGVERRTTTPCSQGSPQDSSEVGTEGAAQFVAATFQNLFDSGEGGVSKRNAPPEELGSASMAKRKSPPEYIIPAPESPIAKAINDIIHSACLPPSNSTIAESGIKDSVSKDTTNINASTAQPSKDNPTPSTSNDPPSTKVQGSK